ncbi:FG-GAP repeat protein [bacterium BMS3Abin03]|nr:FG-GAP repeat protein [bacterium BMS3Abin03]
MKKPLKEDKTGLKTGLKKFSFIFVWLSFLSFAFPQVPVNGFCELKSFPAFPNYNRLLVSDINYDSYEDLLLYSSEQNALVLIEGDEEGTFSDYKIEKASYHFTSIKTIFDYETGSEQFVFISRNSRSAGIFNFSTFGRFNLIDTLTFDSFPENVEIADIENNGDEEFLISGSGFNGLSVLYFENGKLNELKLVKNSSYSEAVFCDLSNDGYPDIAAHNIFDNSIDFFYNNGQGGFTKVRSIPAVLGLTGLAAYDIDKDNYTDLVCTFGKSIKIIFGDFQSSYDETLVVKTELNPDLIIFSDFNNDELTDIAYTDTSEGILSVYYGKSSSEFYKEIFYTRRKGLSDFNLFNNIDEEGIILLNRKGEIYTVTKMNKLPDEANILPAVEPSAIAYFYFGKDRVMGLCYIDNFSSSLNFLINNRKGIPAYFFTADISEVHSKIIVDDYGLYRKAFYCYTPGSKMIEIVNFDFKKNKYKTDQLYTTGGIEDVGVKHTGDSTKIFVAFRKGKELKVSEYDNYDSKYKYKSYPNIEQDVIEARLSVSGVPAIYYWKKGMRNYELMQVKLNPDSISYKKLGDIKEESVFNTTLKLLIDKKRVTSLFFNNKGTNYFTVVANDSMFNISTASLSEFKPDVELKRISSANIIFNDNSVVIYSLENHSFNLIRIDDGGSETHISRLFDAENVTEFVVEKLYVNEHVIVYTNQQEGYISLKRIE